MIPKNELATFYMSVYEANDLAGCGEVLNGYRCLLGGMERATEAGDFEEPWADELKALYREALAAYGQQYGVLGNELGN